ncbi:MAG: hypothetical protein KGK16_18375, partial [Bradyrhizobium sp.]|nr:hypothetical protein [Bradyrhizobium sp.]
SSVGHGVVIAAGNNTLTLNDVLLWTVTTSAFLPDVIVGQNRHTFWSSLLSGGRGKSTSREITKRYL